MAKNKKIRDPEQKKSSRFTANEPEDTDRLPIIFSFERIQTGAYCFSCLSKDDMARVADALFRRKEMTWINAQNSHRRGLGTEKIPKSAIKTSLPPFITEDMNDFLVFRFNGKKPMVGYRSRRIFYILWFDHNFSLYNHGS